MSVKTIKDHLSITCLDESPANHTNARHHPNACHMIWLKSNHHTAKEIMPASGYIHFYTGKAPLEMLTGYNKGFCIWLSADFFNAIQAELCWSFFPVPARISMSAEVMEETEEIIYKMKREQNKEHRLKEEVLKGLLKIFLLYLSGPLMEATVPEKRDTIIMREFYQLISGCISIKKQVADYARELYVSPGYLNQVVKRVSGFPASYHIQQRLVSQAKEKALYSSCSMKEIAYQLGFEDMAHFSRFFKNNSGLKFTDFRKAMSCIS